MKLKEREREEKEEREGEGERQQQGEHFHGVVHCLVTRAVARAAASSWELNPCEWKQLCHLPRGRAGKRTQIV